jgi:hypothetical protein
MSVWREVVESRSGLPERILSSPRSVLAEMPKNRRDQDHSKAKEDRQANVVSLQI